MRACIHPQFLIIPPINAPEGLRIKGAASMPRGQRVNVGPVSGLRSSPCICIDRSRPRSSGGGKPSPARRVSGRSTHHLRQGSQAAAKQSKTSSSFRHHGATMLPGGQDSIEHFRTAQHGMVSRTPQHAFGSVLTALTELNYLSCVADCSTVGSHRAALLIPPFHEVDRIGASSTGDSQTQKP